VDTDKLTLMGEIADTPGVHGIALATDLGAGTSAPDARASSWCFDLNDARAAEEIKTTGENPDAILYDAAMPARVQLQRARSQRHRRRCQDDTVIGTIALDAKPEFAVSDGKGPHLREPRGQEQPPR